MYYSFHHIVYPRYHRYLIYFVYLLRSGGGGGILKPSDVFVLPRHNAQLWEVDLVCRAPLELVSIHWSGRQLQVVLRLGFDHWNRSSHWCLEVCHTCHEVHERAGRGMPCETRPKSAVLFFDQRSPDAAGLMLSASNSRWNAMHSSLPSIPLATT